MLHVLEFMVIEEITVHIKRKKIKNMYLTVHKEDVTVEVRVPMKMPESTIEQFVRSKLEWIRSHQQRFANMEHPKELKYENGEEILLFGNKYKIEIYPQSMRNTVLFDGTIISIYMMGAFQRDKCEAILEEWYRKELSKKLPPLFEIWESIMGVHANEVRIRKMKTRWGTCNTLEKRIWISLELAKKPMECIEYIVVHELAHLLEPSHNRVFHGYMDKFLPDWKIRKKRLNGC